MPLSSTGISKIDLRAFVPSCPRVSYGGAYRLARDRRVALCCAGGATDRRRENTKTRRYEGTKTNLSNAGAAEQHWYFQDVLRAFVPSCLRVSYGGTYLLAGYRESICAVSETATDRDRENTKARRYEDIS